MQAVQFWRNYECFNGKVMLIHFFFFAWFRTMCALECACSRKRMGEKRRFRVFASRFSRKTALIPITIKIIHVQPILSVSLPLSLLFILLSLSVSLIV